MNNPSRSWTVAMSRDSGAGAYSQGMPAPSPSPQLAGARSPLRTTAPDRTSEGSVSVAIEAIMSPRLGQPGWLALPRRKFPPHACIGRFRRETALVSHDTRLVDRFSRIGGPQVPSAAISSSPCPRRGLDPRDRRSGAPVRRSVAHGVVAESACREAWQLEVPDERSPRRRTHRPCWGEPHPLLEGHDGAPRRRAEDAIEREAGLHLLAEEPLDREDGLTAGAGRDRDDQPAPRRRVDDARHRQLAPPLEDSDGVDGGRAIDAIHGHADQVARGDGDPAVWNGPGAHLLVDEVLDRPNVRPSIPEALRRVERRDRRDDRPGDGRPGEARESGDRKPAAGNRRRHPARE